MGCRHTVVVRRAQQLAIAQYCQDLQPWGRCGSIRRHWDGLPAFSEWHARTMCCRRGAGLIARRHSMRGWTCIPDPALSLSDSCPGDSTGGLTDEPGVSPAITDGERFAGLSPVAKFFCPLWSFCLIVVLLGVGARDFSRSSFFQTENKRRALSRAPTAVTRAALGSCNERGARRALAYSAN